MNTWPESNRRIMWRKSTHSAGNGECVGVGRETSAGPGQVYVCDTKLDRSPVLSISAAGWADFVDDVKAGRFDPRE